MHDIIVRLRDAFDPESKIEQCGVITSTGEVMHSPNIHPEPETGFEIDPWLLVKFDDLHGSWHTHVQGTANLSDEDYRGFLQWPKLRHYIVTRDDIRAFEIDNGLILEVDIA